MRLLLNNNAFFCALNAQVMRFFCTQSTSFFYYNIWKTTQRRELRVVVVFLLRDLGWWYVECYVGMGMVVLRPDPLLLRASTLFYTHFFFLHHLVLTTFCSTTECSKFLFVHNQFFLSRFFVAQIFLFCQSFVCNLLPISFFLF